MGIPYPSVQRWLSLNATRHSTLPRASLLRDATQKSRQRSRSLTRLSTRPKSLRPERRTSFKPGQANPPSRGSCSITKRHHLPTSCATGKHHRIRHELRRSYRSLEPPWPPKRLTRSLPRRPRCAEEHPRPLLLARSTEERPVLLPVKILVHSITSCRGASAILAGPSCELPGLPGRRPTNRAVKGSWCARTCGATMLAKNLRGPRISMATTPVG